MRRTTSRGVNTVIAGRVPGGRGVRIHHSGGRITAVEPYLQVPDRWLLPGMIDLQVNGYAGLDVNAAELTTSVIHDLVRAEARCGVTGFCPTVVTAGEERMTHALAVIAAACDEDEWTRHAVLGVHVEGPYLCAEDGPRGAHDATQLRAPNVAEFGHWQAAPPPPQLRLGAAGGDETDGQLYRRRTPPAGRYIRRNASCQGPRPAHPRERLGGSRRLPAG